MEDINSLRKNSIGTSGLIFQAMGQLSPIGIFGGSILGAAAFALGATPLSFIIGLAASLLAGNSIYQYSKKTASARGYYGYIANGLGMTAGSLTAFLYILYEFANLLFILSYYVLTFSPTLSFVGNFNVPDYFGYLYIALITLPAFYVVYRGIKLSYKSQIVANIIQIVFVVSIAIAIIITSPKIGFAPFRVLPSVGLKGIFLGFITGSYLAFAGFGSIVNLGEEAKAGRKSIGRAVISIILIIGVIYLLGSYAMVAGWGLDIMGSFSSSIYPGFVIISKFGRMPNYIFFLLNFFVVYPLFVTMATGLSRNIYAMAKDRMLPSNLTKTHDKHKSPYIAIAYIVVIFIILAIVTSFIFYYMEKGFFNGFFDDFLFFAALSTITTLIIHMLVNFSLYSKYKCEKDYNVKKTLTHVLLPSISTIIIVLAVYYSIVSLAFPLDYAPVIILIFGVISLIYINSKKRVILKFEGGESNE
jgi:amino acid transporter